MTQMPPPYPPAQGPTYAPQGFPPPRQGNMSAVLALIFGLLQCIPLLAGLLAIIFGFMGIKRANNPAVGQGKPLAIIGLVLGFLGLIGWISFIGLGGAAFFWAKAKIEKPREVTVACITELAAGNVDKALTYCHSTMNKKDMAGIAEYLKPMGAFQELSVNGFDLGDATNMVTLYGIVTFDQKKQAFRSGISLENDTWKVASIELRDASLPFSK